MAIPSPKTDILIYVFVFIDKYEWLVCIARFIVGTGISCLAIFDIGSDKPIIDADGNETDSRIWIIAISDGHFL